MNVNASVLTIEKPPSYTSVVDKEYLPTYQECNDLTKTKETLKSDMQSSLPDNFPVATANDKTTELIETKSGLFGIDFLHLWLVFAIFDLVYLFISIFVKNEYLLMVCDRISLVFFCVLCLYCFGRLINLLSIKK